MSSDVIGSTGTRVAERGAIDADTFEREVLPEYAPVILRGQIAQWPAVNAGRSGHGALRDYIHRFAPGAPAELLIGPPDIAGRFFYRDDMRGFNFERRRAPLQALIDELVRIADVENPVALYASAATAAQHMPGWEKENRLDLAMPGAQARLWVGNATQVATHYDISPNLACVVAGTRRFTLFPPEQVANLYVGPLDNTPAGAPVSMVNPESPDMERYPRFSDALNHAQVAELEPGDALFIPAIWWHHVRAFDTLNVLVNYWAANYPATSPFVAMVHAMMSVRELPVEQKKAWRQWFDTFVFDADADRVTDHLPEDARGVAGPPSEERTRQIRHYLLGSLQR